MLLVWLVLLGAIGFLVGVPLYALPASLTLPPGKRPDCPPLTLPQAVRNLKESRLTGAELAEAARALVEERMAYCRRNSFDGHSRAFERGYGYCSQQANALAGLLTRLGLEAQVVHAFRNRFPDGTTASHAWVQLKLDGDIRNLDSIFYDAAAGRITFTPLSHVGAVPVIVKLLEKWGAPAVNAHRYYLTGKDFDR